MSSQSNQDRRDDSDVIGLITEIHKDVRSLSEKLTAHMTAETHELAQEVAKLMKDSFPDGDPLTHRRNHEIQLEIAKKKAAFWSDMASSVSKWGLIGFIGWIGYAAWRAFLLGPKS